MKYLVYGSYGFTGKLIVKEAQRKGHAIILGGRDGDKLHVQSVETGFPYKVFTVYDTAALKATLEEVDAILHCAGPFSETARQVIEACLETKTHYVDITGEIGVFELAAAMGAKAKEAGIVLLPGAGFDVVPTDCMAAYLKSKLNTATHLSMGFHSKSALSRGTALTMAQNLDQGGAIRENGKIKVVKNAYSKRTIHLEGKDRSFVSIPWGDVSTAYYTTGIPNIILYVSAGKNAIKNMERMEKVRSVFGWSFVKNALAYFIRKKVKGPTPDQMEKSSTTIWGEVKDPAGNTFRAQLITPEGYKLTSMTAVDILQRILKGEVKPGFHTPAGAFGYQYIAGFPGVSDFKSFKIEDKE